MKKDKGKVEELTLEQYSAQVAQKVYDKLPKSIVMLLGLSLEDVHSDIESKLDDDNTLISKYPSMQWTTDICWENDLTVDQGVDKIFGDYEKVLIR